MMGIQAYNRVRELTGKPEQAEFIKSLTEEEIDKAIKVASVNLRLSNNSIGYEGAERAIMDIEIAEAFGSKNNSKKVLTY